MQHSERERFKQFVNDSSPGLYRIALALTGGKDRDATAISNLRHVELLDQARGHLARAQAAARDAGAPEEILLADLHDARICFDEVVGRRSSDDVLRHIFERFCIGK